jgi:hypothetical protein
MQCTARDVIGFIFGSKLQFTFCYLVDSDYTSPVVYALIFLPVSLHS